MHYNKQQFIIRAKTHRTEPSLHIIPFSTYISSFWPSGMRVPDLACGVTAGEQAFRQPCLSPCPVVAQKELPRRHVEPILHLSVIGIAYLNFPRHQTLQLELLLRLVGPQFLSDWQ